MNSTDDYEYQDYLAALTDRLVYYVIMSLTPMVLISSVLIMIVFQSKELKKQSMSVYYCIQAIFDFVYILNKFIHYYVIINTPERLSTLVCRIVFGSVYVSSAIRIYMLVFATLDRFMFIVHPSRLQFIRKKLFQCVLLGVSMVAFTSYYVPYILNTKYDEEPYCVIIDSDIYSIYNWMDLGIFCIFPSVIMITCSIKLIITIRQSKKKSNQQTSDKSEKQRKDTCFAANILTIDVLFLVATFIKYTSGGIYSLISSSFDSIYNEHYGELWIGIDVCAVVSILANFGTPFWIHLKTNKIFQRKFIQFFNRYLKCVNNTPMPETMRMTRSELTVFTKQN